MIAYHILCHDNLAQVVRLVDALDAPDVTVLVDVDHGRGPNLKPLDALRARPNVHVKLDSDIGWGGGGTLRKTIEGAFELLELSPSWTYYIVLSGQDLPIASDEAIRQRLARGHEKRTNFIASTRIDPVEAKDYRVINTGTKAKPYDDRGHTKLYTCPGTISPHAHMHARTLVDMIEVGVKGQVYVNRCDALLTRRRKDFFERHPYHMGANWFDLHRSLLEHLRGDPFAYELYDLMRTTYIPDESYFQTYIASSPFRDTVDLDYGRLIVRPEARPDVHVFGTADRALIDGSGAMFGRKFDTRRDDAIVDHVLERRAA